MCQSMLMLMPSDAQTYCDSPEGIIEVKPQKNGGGYFDLISPHLN